MARRPRRRRRAPDPVVAIRQAVASGQPWARPASDLEMDLRLYELVSGHDHFGLGWADDDDARRAAWKQLGPSITAAHIEREPGTRPWAWWRYAAPEPRRLVDGDDVVLETAGDWFGSPAARGNGRYESQATYLRRLKLAERGEIHRPPKLEPDDPASAYARAVLDGDVVACKYVKWACDRHFSDLDNVGTSGHWFDRARADRMLQFFRYCRHHSGRRWASKVFVPEPFQQFTCGSIFGWVGEDRMRRFTSAWFELSKKNGKTPTGTVIGLYMKLADREPGAEVYIAATKKEQARIAYNYAIRMRRQSSILSMLTHATRYELRADWNSAVLRAISSDSETEDGMNVHYGLADEVHAHPDDSMVRVLRNGMVNRDQPLLMLITTAGFDQESFGAEESQHMAKLLDPRIDIDDPTRFAIIYTLDDPSEIEDPAMWVKANPNLGISVNTKRLSEAVESSKGKPVERNSVLTKNFGIWTSAKQAWLDMDAWHQCSSAKGDPIAWRVRMLKALRGEKCMAGLDLAQKLDLNALVLDFYERSPRVLIPYFWLPMARASAKKGGDRVPYTKWHQEGFLDVTPGNVIDYEFIRATILGTTHPDGSVRTHGLSGMFQIEQVAYDPHFATETAQKLQDDGGLVMVPCIHGYKTYSEPCGDLEAALASSAIDHGSNPIMTMCARNIEIKVGAQGHKMPDRKPSRRKHIDGVIALLLARSRSILMQETSLYETQGLRVL